MPVTQSSTVSYHLVEATVRMDPETFGPVGMAVTFARRIDGLTDRTESYLMPAEDLGAYLMAAPTPGAPRGVDLTDAIYVWAIGAGHITGEVS